MPRWLKRPAGHANDFVAAALSAHSWISDGAAMLGDDDILAAFDVIGGFDDVGAFYMFERWVSMRSELRDKVVVITGASSGIGRATARRFAEHGAKLVVAARRARPLDQAVRECVIRGGEAIAVQVDVCNPESMENLARRAVESYGRVDIWINNAAVSLYARVDEGPLEVHRRVIETNLLGCLYGARLAVHIFRRQGRGVLVNVSSAAAYVGQPYTSAYVASKFGIRGLSDSFAKR